MDSYTQKYRKVWESDPSFKKWIRPSKQETKAVCIYCHATIRAKRSDLVRHSLSAKHKRAMKPFNNVELTQPEVSFKAAASEKQCSQAALALYTAVHSPFLSMDHLGEVCCTVFKDSKGADFCLHRTKCANIITNVLAPHFIEELLHDLNDSSFSLILDEGMPQ